MAHVITQNCCSDAACVAVCPVNCIHPSPGEPDYATVEMLYIDPVGCIDCGACIDACPVEAISPDYDLTDSNMMYADLNARYYEAPGRVSSDPPVVADTERFCSAPAQTPLKVAIVGAGPAAFYAAEEVLSQRSVVTEVDMFERLPAPGGLLRYGVAPDHAQTKRVADAFAVTARRKGFRLFSNVEIGADISHDELAQRYHAVVYAVGLAGDRNLGVPGEDLPGSYSATEFVAWYNGHPDFATRSFDLSCERAVIVGNGNVAFDVARILASEVSSLARTDIAEHALAQLAESRIREVVVVGRRGVAEGAFTTPELIGLSQVPGIDLVADDVSAYSAGDAAPSVGPYSMGPVKHKLIADLAGRPSTGGRRISLRFLRSPVEILGDSQVEGIRLVRNELERDRDLVFARPTDDIETIACGMVVRAVGYRGHAVVDLPFDGTRSRLPHVAGRVVDPVTGEALRGMYAVGWIKRGPSGGIGTNKSCARETIGSLFRDFAEGVLNDPRESSATIGDLAPGAVDLQGWRRVDAHERSLGRASRRPRVKLVEVDRMLEIARESSTT